MNYLDCKQNEPRRHLATLMISLALSNLQLCVLNEFDCRLLRYDRIVKNVKIKEILLSEQPPDKVYAVTFLPF